MIVPNPTSALNEEAGKLLLEHYDDYSRQARMMTEIHALQKKNNEEIRKTEISMTKKRPAEEGKKKKTDKKRALKRL